MNPVTKPQAISYQQQQLCTECSAVLEALDALGRRVNDGTLGGWIGLSPSEFSNLRNTAMTATPVADKKLKPAADSLEKLKHEIRVVERYRAVADKPMRRCEFSLC